MERRYPLVWILLPCLLLLLATGVQARTIDDFVGHYIGHAESEDELGRDMSVEIDAVPGTNDYYVKWSTVIHKTDGRTKRVTYNIRFQPSARKGVHVSAMARNVFGKAVPLDPMHGDPLVWARIKGDTHTVYAMIITDEGGFELQVYNRTLNQDGLWLEFTRKRDDQPIRTVTAQLVRVSH